MADEPRDDTSTPEHWGFPTLLVPPYDPDLDLLTYMDRPLRAGKPPKKQRNLFLRWIGFG